MEKSLNFNVSLEEANLVLNGLSNLPFIQVNKLIAKLQEQATLQLKESDDKDILG